jgi:hypothetical protein
MPIAASQLFDQIGLEIKGIVRWGSPVPCKSSGVYAVSLCDDPERNAGLIPKAPVSNALVGRWIRYVPTFSFDGKPRPSPPIVAAFLASMWLPDESIVYLGKATCLKKRLRQFHKHTLGNPKPHAGGHWLKTLTILERMHIFFCECRSAAEAEDKEKEALRAFVAQVSKRTLKGLYNAQLPIPFANREYPKGTRKQFRISGDVYA